jgi:hypothetical protein
MNPFEYNEKPTEQMLSDLTRFRELFRGLHDTAQLLVPNSRERSLALTRLEEASHWLNRAITHPLEHH